MHKLNRKVIYTILTNSNYIFHNNKQIILNNISLLKKTSTNINSAVSVPMNKTHFFLFFKENKKNKAQN
jgi:hypothetical protein